jgi:hypothetical protein
MSKEPEGIDPATGQTKSASEKFKKLQEQQGKDAEKQAEAAAKSEEDARKEYQKEREALGVEFPSSAGDKPASTAKDTK